MLFFTHQMDVFESLFVEGKVLAVEDLYEGILQELSCPLPVQISGSFHSLERKVVIRCAS
jgi:hypothetical protein